MGIRETIQNRATNQSAAWAIAAAIIAPLVTALTNSQFTAMIPMENLVFSFAMLAMLLLFIKDDKKQEHNNAAATLTNPKTTERLSDNMADVAKAMKSMETDAIKAEVDKYIKDLDLQPKTIQKIVEVEKVVYEPVDRIIYVPAESEPEVMEWSEPENTTKAPMGILQSIIHKEE